MGSLMFHISSVISPRRYNHHCPKLVKSDIFTISKFHGSSCPTKFSRKRPVGNPSPVKTWSSSNPHGSQEEKAYEEQEESGELEELRIPDHWLIPSKALEESEWLRVTLHKWLDDEYCPEETNVEISKVAASSYYKSLLDKRRDLSEILLKMARELESISYQDSFHGAFSSANAAIDLICQRIEQE